MTDVNLDFIYQGNAIRIQGKRNEYVKDIVKRYIVKIGKDLNDIYFMSNGNKINQELKLEEINNKDKEIKVLVNDINDKNINNKEEESKQNKDILCPECGNICLSPIILSLISYTNIFISSSLLLISSNFNSPLILSPLHINKTSLISLFILIRYL